MLLSMLLGADPFQYQVRHNKTLIIIKQHF
jgi:hypothetical protein